MTIFSARQRLYIIAPGVTVRQRLPVGAAAASWWEAGGATGAVAAYQPVGAASLAASYTNLANPGTFDAAPGVAPTWNATDGWVFNGVNQYLTTGVVPGAQYTALIQFTDATVAGRTLCGALGSAGQGRYFLQPYNGTGTAAVWSNTDATAVTTAAPGMAAGNLAMAYQTCYRNGVSEAVVPGTSAMTQTFYIGGINSDDSSVLYGVAHVRAFAIYNNDIGASAVTAVSAEMAAL